MFLGVRAESTRSRAVPAPRKDAVTVGTDGGHPNATRATRAQVERERATVEARIHITPVGCRRRPPESYSAVLRAVAPSAPASEGVQPSQCADAE
jgi:hypothetical protein